jgi:hypothetical protein
VSEDERWTRTIKIEPGVVVPAVQPLVPGTPIFVKIAVVTLAPVVALTLVVTVVAVPKDAEATT